jgi:hypothetical protein
VERCIADNVELKRQVGFSSRELHLPPLSVLPWPPVSG